MKKVKQVDPLLPYQLVATMGTTSWNTISAFDPSELHLIAGPCARMRLLTLGFFCARSFG